MDPLSKKLFSFDKSKKKKSIVNKTGIRKHRKNMSIQS